MRLDKATGTKCYTLSARALHIAWGDTPEYWKWINLDCDEVKSNKRFLEAAKLQGVWWLEIRAKINGMMLSQNLTYAAYMVFKLAADGFNLLGFPYQNASISVSGSNSMQKVCLQSYMEAGDDGVPQKHILKSSFLGYSHYDEVPLTDDIILPRKRADG
ncbi:F-box protein PP2-B1-like [Lolium rigidum]|uniref:F-box protein PP2-B1-like n=1 Tax=Lolium rigidum TaxID=89674 RepID=UPI001F5CDA88|nr:F-box protein PP2-B1-like [Lolium rigidum]